ncbi:MAG: hypothetical protein JXA25_13435 [Anaerolineales bacterium]|nr:hypothetical protein [Anaerolineales bacterium]
MDNPYRLSVEEWALALSLAGAGQQSEALLRTYLGELSDDMARERMHAAGHSLIARGLLDIDPEGAAPLDPDFMSCVKAMAAADYSLRFGRSNEAVDMFLTYHFKDGKLYEQALEYGVVIELTTIQDMKDVIQGGMDFYDVEKHAGFKAGPVQLPYAQLEDLTGVTDLDQLDAALKSAGVGEKERVLLKEDLAAARSRGSVLLVTYPGNTFPQSDHGFLTLEGPERMWLVSLEEVDGEMTATLKPGSRKTFEAEVSALLTVMA